MAIMAGDGRVRVGMGRPGAGADKNEIRLAACFDRTGDRRHDDALAEDDDRIGLLKLGLRLLHDIGGGRIAEIETCVPA